MSANSLGDVHELSPFRFWCQRVLPLVYDDNLSYYELLCKVVDYINNLITDEQQLVTAYEELNGTLGFVTPEMFGAKGDGITDDSNAFQNALNNYSNILLVGSYLVKGLTIKSNTFIFGSGKIIQNSDSVENKLFDVSNKSNISFYGITLVSGTATSTTDTEGCARFTNCENITFENVKFENNARRFLLFNSCNSVIVSNFVALNSKGTVITGTDSDFVTFCNGLITIGENPFTAHGIDMYAKAGKTVSGASIHHILVNGAWDTGIQMTANQKDGGSFETFVFSDNVAIGCATAFKQDGLGKCHFDNCRCYSCTTNYSCDGISTISCEELILNNCYVKSNGVNATTGLWQAFPNIKKLIANNCEIENYLCPIRTENIIEHLIMKNCYIHSTGKFTFFRNITDVIGKFEFINNTVIYGGTIAGVASDPFTPSDTLIMKDNTFAFPGLTDTGNVIDFAVTDFFVFSGNIFDGKMASKFRVNLPQGRRESENKCTVIYYGNVRRIDTSVIDMIALNPTDHVIASQTYQSV